MAGVILAAAAIGVVAAGLSGGVATVNTPVSGVIAGSGNCTTTAAVVVPVGGHTPDTYAWTQVEGDDNWTINHASSTSPSATFTYSSLLHGDRQSAEFKCVVTDGAATSDLYVIATVSSTSTL